MINRLPLTVGFARVSQATEDQGNLETQTRQLQDHGVHELVTETGSGAGSDRLALRDLQARLQAGDTLVVTAIDRISRRAVDGLRFIRDATGAGVHLVVLSQREFDTATPTGQLLLHLTLAIAEWEWSNIRGQERARAEGKRIGRPPALTPEARREVEHKLREGQSVNRISQVHRVHHSVVRRVARELEELEELEAERLVEENNQGGSCPKRLPMNQSAGHLTEPRHRRT